MLSKNDLRVEEKLDILVTRGGHLLWEPFLFSNNKIKEPLLRCTGCCREGQGSLR